MALATATPYQLKDSPYSSHSLLLASLPASGDGRRVLGCRLRLRLSGSDSGGPRLSRHRHRFAGRAPRRLPGIHRILRSRSGSGTAALYRPVRFRDLRGRAGASAPPRISCCANCVRCWPPADGWPASLPNSGHAYFRWNVSHRPFSRRRSGPVRPHAPAFLYLARLAGSVPRVPDSASKPCAASGVPIGLALPKWEGSAAGARAGTPVVRIGALVEKHVRLSIHRHRRAGDRTMTAKPKVVVVMPAYNAAKTLHMTYQDLPREHGGPGHPGGRRQFRRDRPDRARHGA